MPDDFIFSPDGQQVQPFGDLASYLIANGMNVNSLRTNSTLRKDDWELLDRTVVQTARERLNGVADLIFRGLVLEVPNGLGTTVVQHETISEMIAAEVSMDGITRGQFDRTLYNLVSTPLPIIHRDFQLSARNLEASRKSGTPLDTTMAAEASRQVSERIEDILFNGLTREDTLGFGSDSAQLFGYTNRTNRNTVSIGTAWNASAATGTTILADVLAMITSAHADRMFGPYMLYVPTNFWVDLLDDFKTNSDKSIISRLKEIPSLIDVKPADKLTASNVVMVQMTRDNVDMVIGMQPTTVQWQSQGGMQLNFKVMAIMVPRIKLDSGNRSGVVHLS